MDRLCSAANRAFEQLEHDVLWQPADATATNIMSLVDAMPTPYSDSRAIETVCCQLLVIIIHRGWNIADHAEVLARISRQIEERHVCLHLAPATCGDLESIFRALEALMSSADMAADQSVFLRIDAAELFPSSFLRDLFVHAATIRRQRRSRMFIIMGVPDRDLEMLKQVMPSCAASLFLVRQLYLAQASELFERFKTAITEGPFSGCGLLLTSRRCLQQLASRFSREMSIREVFFCLRVACFQSLWKLQELCPAKGGSAAPFLSEFAAAVVASMMDGKPVMAGELCDWISTRPVDLDDLRSLHSMRSIAEHDLSGSHDKQRKFLTDSTFFVEQLLEAAQAAARVMRGRPALNALMCGTLNFVCKPVEPFSPSSVFGLLETYQTAAPLETHYPLHAVTDWIGRCPQRSLSELLSLWRSSLAGPLATRASNSSCPADKEMGANALLSDLVATFSLWSSHLAARDVDVGAIRVGVQTVWESVWSAVFLPRRRAGDVACTFLDLQRDPSNGAQYVGRRRTIPFCEFLSVGAIASTDGGLGRGEAEGIGRSKTRACCFRMYGAQRRWVASGLESLFRQEEAGRVPPVALVYHLIQDGGHGTLLNIYDLLQSFTETWDSIHPPSLESGSQPSAAAVSDGESGADAAAPPAKRGRNSSKQIARRTQRSIRQAPPPPPGPSASQARECLLQALFFDALRQLEYIGYIGYTNRKADHLVRKAFL